MPDEAAGNAPERDAFAAFAGDGGHAPLLLQPRVLIGIALAFAVLVGGYFAAADAFDVSLSIDAERLQDWVGGWGPWGPVAFVAVMGLSVLFAPIPNAPIFFAAGLIWGPALGTVYCLAGLLWGSAAAFWTARRLGRRHLPRLVGAKTAARLDGLTLRMGGQLIFWARMVPVVNFDWISFLAGLTAIGFWRFFIFSGLGMIIPTGVAVAAGDSLGRDFRLTLAIGGGWLAGVLLSALYFWWRQRRDAPADEEVEEAAEPDPADAPEPAEPAAEKAEAAGP